MTLGRGIAHSERTDAALRVHTNRLFGIQSWVALPKEAEEMEPEFAHYAGRVFAGYQGWRNPTAADRRRGLGSRAPVIVSSRSSMPTRCLRHRPNCPCQTDTRGACRSINPLHDEGVLDQTVNDYWLSWWR